MYSGFIDFRMPLYSVGAGDLDITAQALNDKLTQIFDISTSWGAIVLIDEADVFLEERSVNDLQRNAMVAVFLRQLEYATSYQSPSCLAFLTDKIFKILPRYPLLDDEPRQDL